MIKKYTDCLGLDFTWRESHMNHLESNRISQTETDLHKRNHIWM